MAVFRRVVLGLAALSIVTSVGAVAAGLDVTAGSLASGGDLVDQCDTDGVDVSWGPVVYDSSISGYKITTVTLSDVDQPDCANMELRFRLSGAGGIALGAEKVLPDVDSLTAMTFDFTIEDIAAADVDDVHVLLSER